jgi:hypothetical protein
MKLRVVERSLAVLHRVGDHRVGMLALYLVTVAVTAARADWDVTEVPTPPGWTGDTEAYDVNDDGLVCGIGAYVSGSSCVAFVYDGDTLTELPYLAPAATYPFAYAYAINNSGVVAGWSHNADSIDRAVCWSGGTVTQIPEPGDIKPTGDMRAYGINDAGVVVGYYVATDGYAAAYYYDGATHSLRSALQAAGLTGLRSYARDVNSSGLICGHAEDAADYNFFTYDITTGIVAVLGKMYPSESCHSAALNDAGHIIGRGRSDPFSPIHALVHTGTFQIIDDTITDAQWASGIATDGRVVGSTNTGDNRWGWYSDAPGSNSMHAVSLPGWTGVSIYGINDYHVMVGHGRTAASGTDERAFVITPPAGDGNHDGNVDAADVPVFSACLSGPAEGTGFTPPAEGCLRPFDLDSTDGDVDLVDFAVLQELLDGS